jgi:MarR-like DNA-binding transcriptional regulator SgrR of sgrS sRNA
MAFGMGKLQVTRLRPARSEARASLAGPANRAVFLLVHPRYAKAFPHGVAPVFAATFQRGTMASFLSDVDLAPGDGVTSCLLNVAARSDVVWKKDEERPPSAPLKDLPRRLELLLFPEEEWLRRLSQRIQVDLAKLGLSVEVREVDREAILRRQESREYDLLLFEPLPLVRSALLQWISILSAAEPAQGAEELFQVLRQWEEAEKRVAMLADRARSWQARLPWFLLFCQGQRVWAQSAVRDLVVFPDGLLDYANVWLTE